MIRIGFFALLALLILPQSASADAASQATRIFYKLNGYLLPAGAIRTQMESAINQGNPLAAARIATSQDAFYNITLVEWASPLQNREESSRVALSDFTAMIVGTVRDETDARTLLTGDFTYVSDPSLPGNPCTGANCQINFSNPDAHYAAVEAAGVNLRQYLVRQEVQWPQVPNSDAAGLLTSRAWAQSFLSAGTNRRAIQYAMQEFLCKPISELMNPLMPDSYYHRIRRDVDRAPGGDANVFATTCRGCHGPMDAMAGAYAYFDNVLPIQTQTIQAKMNRNNNVFPAGYITVDNSWINYFTEGRNADIGWRGERQGYGVRALGNLLSNSMAFSQCMSKRVFKQVCSREPHSSEGETIARLASDFESSNYNLRSLFESAAILPACIGQ